MPGPDKRVRGIPDNPVTCISCRQRKGSPADALCHGCRIQRRPNPNKRFWWTPELDQQLRSCYQESRSRAALTKSLDALQKRTGFTRVVILARGAQLGLNAPLHRWTQTEINALDELAGTCSKSAIARKLRRSYWSVKAQCAKQHISGRLSHGYSRGDVGGLLGTSARSVRKWIDFGWLKLQQGRITEASMARFLREHPEEYRLNWVDETWFKGLLFPAFGRNHMPLHGAIRKQPSPDAAA